MVGEHLNNNDLIVNGENFHYLINVLRLKKDSIFYIFNGIDKEIKAKIIKIDKSYLTAKVLEEKNILSKPHIIIDIAQAIPKKDKMDLIIEKCTELGVNNIYPVITKRTIPQLDDKKEIKRIERWKKIAKSASIQSKRDNIPEINNILPISKLLEKADNYDLVIVPWEEEKIISLKQALKNKKSSKKILVVIGPEGGFSSDEINIFKKYNATIVSLGKRILRTETAALAVLSIINYEFGL